MNFIEPCHSKKYGIYKSEILHTVLKDQFNDHHHSELVNLWNGQMGSRQGMGQPTSVRRSLGKHRKCSKAARLPCRKTSKKLLSLITVQVMDIIDSNHSQDPVKRWPIGWLALR